VQAGTLLTERAILQRRANSGAHWFFWIAGLSLVNSFSAFAGSGMRFIVGLGLTQIFDQVAGGSNRPGALLLDIVAAGIFVGFGMLARKQHDWAFLVGMIVYGLDSLIFVMAKNVLSIAFHLLALYFIYRGMRASEALAKLGSAAA
jgi:hypothetical protein